MKLEELIRPRLSEFVRHWCALDGEEYEHLPESEDHRPDDRLECLLVEQFKELLGTLSGSSSIETSGYFFRLPQVCPTAGDKQPETKSMETPCPK